MLNHEDRYDISVRCVYPKKKKALGVSMTYHCLCQEETKCDSYHFFFFFMNYYYHLFLFVIFEMILMKK